MFRATQILMIIVVFLAVELPARADITIFPVDSFGVAGPIPTPGNLATLEGPPSAGTSVRFDPGDLGFLQFGEDISGFTSGGPAFRLDFDITAATPAAGTGDLFLSVLLGNLSTGAGGFTTFALAPTPGLQTPNGDASLFQFTEVRGTGIFSVNIDAFVAGCVSIGGCNAIVIGTSGLGAAGGGSFTDGGTLTFSSVVASTPEPATWALMIMGFIAVAWQAKRQRQSLLAGRSNAALLGDPQISALHTACA